MPQASRLYEEWGKYFQTKPPDNIKLDNPYAGKFLFKASYTKEPRPDISHLLCWEYGRRWKREHTQYIDKRKKKETPVRIKPDIYARRRLLQPKNPNEPQSVNRSKKYEKTQKKIDNGK